MQRYWYTEKVDYQEVRGALRRSFSGEKVREVEAEYFQFGREIDVERCAQGIVIDLAAIVDTKRDTIRQTFGNAMRLVRGISRDEEEATRPADGANGMNVLGSRGRARSGLAACRENDVCSG